MQQFLMWEMGSRQKGQNERRNDHLSSCVYIVEVLETERSGRSGRAGE